MLTCAIIHDAYKNAVYVTYVVSNVTCVVYNMCTRTCVCILTYMCI